VEQGKQTTVDDYRQHHILFTVDNSPQNYVRELVSTLT
jgi:hypothetical protein